MHIFGMVTSGQSSHFTKLALESFLDATELAPEDLFYLIDDDCEFELPDHLNFAQLRILRNRRPASLARNMNRVLTKALEYAGDVVLLKNDTVFTSGWLPSLLTHEPMIVAAVTNQEVQYECNELTVNSEYTLSEYSSQSQLIPQLVDIHREKKLGAHKVLAVPFAACRIPFEILKQVGFLDENYGRGGGEDFDYCLRAQLEGYSVAFAGDCYLIHFGNSTQAAKELPRQERLRYLADATDRFICKWGIPLADLIMRKNSHIVMKNPVLRRAIQQQRHSEIVVALAEGSHQPELAYAPPSDILIADTVAA